VALGSPHGLDGAAYGDGRFMGGSAGAAKRSPQHFLVNDQLNYIRTVTRSFRAAELIVMPKRTRTYWGRYTPKTAARLAGGVGPTDAGAPFAGTGLLNGGHAFNLRRVRETLVARSRLFKSIAAQQRAQV
jgi:hypothetical protein